MGGQAGEEDDGVDSQTLAHYSTKQIPSLFVCPFNIKGA